MGSTLVHFSVYNPKAPNLFKAGPNDRAEAHFVWCSLEGTCALRNKGECLHRTLFGEGCPYGSYERATGPTKRASGLGKWVQNQEDRARAELGQGTPFPYLKGPASVLATIGDYVWFPYAQMEFHRDSTKMWFDLFRGGRRCLPRADVTPELVIQLCEYRPNALMGGEISSYQRDSVPKFVQLLREVLPDIYEQTRVIYPRIDQILGTVSNIGREAVLGTLKPNVGVFEDIHKGHWVWDGVWLTSTDSHMSSGLVREFSEIRVKADPTCRVKVTDEGQVTPETEFRT